MQNLEFTFNLKDILIVFLNTSLSRVNNLKLIDDKTFESLYPETTRENLEKECLERDASDFISTIQRIGSTNFAWYQEEMKDYLINGYHLNKNKFRIKE